MCSRKRVGAAGWLQLVKYGAPVQAKRPVINNRNGHHRREEAKLRVFAHIAALTRKVHVNMPDVIGLASATHIRSAVSPRFTNTGSFCGRTLGASEKKTARQGLRQDKG